MIYRFSKAASAVMALSLFITGVIAAQARASEQNPRLISTNGEGTVFVVPDEALVTLGVQTASGNLKDATSQNEDLAGSLVKAIKSLGVEDKHVATATMQVELRYKDNNVDVEAYVVRRMYMVTLKDVKKLDALITTSLRSGANRFDGVQFRTTELRKYRDQARSMATKAAKEKADALAKDLGCKVGSPVTINEGGYGYWGLQQRLDNNFAQNAAAQAPGAGESEAGETLPLGQIGVTASVSVTFDLVP